jgi:hypothetical protein
MKRGPRWIYFVSNSRKSNEKGEYIYLFVKYAAIKYLALLLFLERT